MNYRKYGRTDRLVSEIGMGGHREGVEFGKGSACTARFFTPAQERAGVVGRALDHGVNYFDTTYGCEIASLGESLRILKRRDGLFVSGMRVDFFKNMIEEEIEPARYVRREVETRLREFGFDHIDQYMLGALEFADPLAKPRSMMEDVFAEMFKLRDEGKFRHVGYSCHSSDYAARLLEAFPDFDAVMTPYNFVNRASEGNLSAAVKKTGAAWIAMKPLVWRFYGIPVTAMRNLPAAGKLLRFDPSAPVAKLALQFLLQNQLLATCVAAMNTADAADEDCAASGGGTFGAGEEHVLEGYARATEAENMAPLAIAGLFEKNARSQAYAIRLMRQKLGFPAAIIDWEKDDAPRLAERAAAEALQRLRADKKWAVYLP